MRQLTLAILCLGLLAGCQTGGVQIQRALFTPRVAPEPDEERLSASVGNFGQPHWGGGTLEVYGWYNPNPNDSSPNIQRAVYFQGVANVPPLDPGATEAVFVQRAISAFGLQPGSIPGSSCAKPACNGHLHLILKEKWGMQVKPPNTNVSITWEKSGALADLKIVDEGP